MNEKVSIIVATLNESEFIGRLIDSVNSCSYPNKEIIVVDGGSKDKTVEIAREKGAKAIEESGEPRCPSHARNQGVRYSDAEIVCVMDADEEVVNGFITNAIRHFDEKDVVAVKPGERSVVIDSFVEELHAKNIDLKKKISNLIYQRFASDRISVRESSDPIPKFYFWRRSAWLEIGGHPETAGWKELVIFKKRARQYLKKNNYRAVVEPNSKVYFHMQHSWRSLFRSFRWYGRTMIDYFKTDEDAGLRMLFANLHQMIIFLFVLFAFFPLPIVRFFFLSLLLIRFLVGIPPAVSERSYTYLATPLIDIVGGLGILIGLMERARGRSLTRG